MGAEQSAGAATEAMAEAVTEPRLAAPLSSPSLKTHGRSNVELLLGLEWQPTHERGKQDAQCELMASLENSLREQVDTNSRQDQLRTRETVACRLRYPGLG